MQVKNLADDPAHGATLTALQKELAVAGGARVGGGGKWPYR